MISNVEAVSGYNSTIDIDLGHMMVPKACKDSATFRNLCDSTLLVKIN